MTALHAETVVTKDAHRADAMEQREYDDQAERRTPENEEAPAMGATLQEKLSFINSHKIAANRPVYVATPGGSNGAGVRPATASSSGGTSSASGQAHWVQPSGPRRPGEGTENEEQGIISAERQPGGGVVLRITLLAAGFLIGPAGSSVREIMRVTGCDIKSWTDSASKSRHSTKRPCRVFVVDGDDDAVGAAMDIITTAVDRYKELCEGRCQGQSVTRQQRVMGVEFSYQPPPRNVVPFAAALKGNITRPPAKTGSDLTGRVGALPGSPLVPMLPGYLMPMPGTYMTPGSPTTGLPFPMYMTSRGPTYQDLDLTGGQGGQIGGGTDMYGTNFDAMNPMSQLLGSAGQAGWPMNTQGLGGGGGYAYPAAVDPASMMAYMNLMMPPNSPPGTFTALEPSAALNMGSLPPFPAATSMPRTDPMHGGMGTAFVSNAGASMGSPPQQAMYNPQDESHTMMGHRQSDMGAFSSVKPLPMGSPGGPARVEFISNPGDAAGGGGGGGGYGHMSVGGMSTGAMPTIGPAGGLMMPGAFATMAPYGCWYPSSPAGVAYGSTAAWGGAQQGATGQMGMHNLPGSLGVHAVSSPTGSMPSPSRLNPKAQPWASPTGHHAGFPTSRGPPHEQRSEPYSMRHRPDTNQPPGGSGHSTSAPGTEAGAGGRSPPFVPGPGGPLNRPPITHPLADSPAGTGTTTVGAGQSTAASSTATASGPPAPPMVAPAAPMAGAKRVPAAPLVAGSPPASTGATASPPQPPPQPPPQRRAPPSTTTLKIDDSLPRVAPMAVGKTPKRPSATGYHGQQHSDRMSAGSTGVGYSPTSSSASAGTTSGAHSGAARGRGSNGLYGSSSAGGEGHGSPTRPMVSSEDPLISPSRFTRGAGQMRRPRSQQALNSEGSSTSTPAALTALPGLLEAMTMKPPEPAAVEGYQPAPTVAEAAT